MTIPLPIHQNLVSFLPGIPKDSYISKYNMPYSNLQPMNLNRGQRPYLTPYQGWIRFALNTSKYSAFNEKISSDGRPGEWAISYFPIGVNSVDDLTEIINNGFSSKVFIPKSGSDISKYLNISGQYSPGIYLFNSILALETEFKFLLNPTRIDTNDQIYLVLQCRYDPSKATHVGYGIYDIEFMNSFTLNDIIPYGIVAKYITSPLPNQIASFVTNVTTQVAAPSLVNPKTFKRLKKKSNVKKCKQKKIETKIKGVIKYKIDFKRYIYKVLKLIHPGTKISQDSMNVMNSFINDMLERIVLESKSLKVISKKSTLTSKTIESGTKLILPGELCKHAISHGLDAVLKSFQKK